jgi:thiol-disulfide isomerase/thioredoxin
MSQRISVLALVAVLTGVPAAVYSVAGQNTDGDIVAAVRAAIAAKDLARGNTLVGQFRSAHGVTPEVLEALSWLGRGALAVKDLDKAEAWATETHTLTIAALKSRKLDEDAHLQTALGAAIETEALVRVERGARSEAVYFLRQAIETYRNTAIHKRLAKDLNLLSLEGQPALRLEVTEYLDRPVPTFAALKGKVVLLFFWAHWCSDCKAESPIIAKLLDKYRSQGLVVVAPTQRFGYTATNQSPSSAEELRYIVQVRDTYYSFLRNQPVPVSEANHRNYGVSSTPTLVLVDRDGLVRLYHPGQMTEAELETAIVRLLPAARSARP